MRNLLISTALVLALGACGGEAVKEAGDSVAAAASEAATEAASDVGAAVETAVSGAGAAAEGAASAAVSAVTGGSAETQVAAAAYTADCLAQDSGEEYCGCIVENQEASLTAKQFNAWAFEEVSAEDDDSASIAFDLAEAETPDIDVTDMMIESFDAAQEACESLLE